MSTGAVGAAVGAPPPHPTPHVTIAGGGGHSHSHSHHHSSTHSHSSHHSHHGSSSIAVSGASPLASPGGSNSGGGGGGASSYGMSAFGGSVRDLELLYVFSTESNAEAKINLPQTVIAVVAEYGMRGLNCNHTLLEGIGLTVWCVACDVCS